MKNDFISMYIFLLICSACAPAVATQPHQADTSVPPTTTAIPPTEVFHSFSSVNITASSLANNLINESTQRTIYVYLLPS